MSTAPRQNFIAALAYSRIHISLQRYVFYLQDRRKLGLLHRLLSMSPRTPTCAILIDGVNDRFP